jgi:hypothetical protein
MSENREALMIRAEIDRLPNRGRGRRYPNVLRKRVLSYIQSRQRQGASPEQISAELGLVLSTLQRWQKQTSPAAEFERIEIVGEPIAPSGLVVHGPAGLRIEGLDLAGVAELVRRLQ